MSTRRSDILDAVIDELDRNGLGDRSLRDLASAVGTSHRMLIHHFGSRAGLLVAVVETVEAAERERSEVAQAVGNERPGDALRAGWRRLAAPAQAGRERLFFECYARALQGEAPFDRLVPGAVDQWLDATEPAARAAGGRPSDSRPAARAEARAGARLGLAVVRGLLLDLLATGDRAGTTRALELYAAMVDAAVAARRPPEVR